MKWRKPKNRVARPGDVLLKDFLNASHPLSRLANVVNWGQFERQFGKLYAVEMGRPALPTRLLVGLHYLKYLYNVSDEVVVASWVENPYWQYFCGEAYFMHEWPCDPTSLVKWRQRVGVEGSEKVLKESLAAAQREALLPAAELKRVNVDTTVQEKAIAFPTDARLYHKARQALVRVARCCNFKLRQSYVRLSKRALVNQGRYGAARQRKRARRETRKLRTYLGRVLRNVERGKLKLAPKQEQVVSVAQRIFTQQRTDHGKVYSVHAPEVECIAKGKAQKHYEFGCKVPIVTTSQNNWIVGIDAVHDNPYDGATLKPALAQVKRLTGTRPEEVFVDKGFRGQRYHPKGVAVYITGWRNLTPLLSKLLNRRSAIEPVIGHTKHDHGMNRNYLLGKVGDRINTLLSGAAWNLKKLWRHFVAHPLPVPVT
ncbi:MAG: IS5 family transposase [Deltaproteobacteria bacterium]|nr:IS5 family transposase [Deltaproteobacteria bacterium]